MSNKYQSLFSQAQDALAQKQTELDRLAIAHADQLKRVEELQSATRSDLSSADLNALMHEATVVMESGQKLATAESVLSEIERRIVLQKTTIMNAEQAIKLLQAKILSDEAYQLEAEIYSGIEKQVQKAARVLELEREISELVSRTRDMAFTGNVLSMFEIGQRQFEEHRQRYSGGDQTGLDWQVYEQSQAAPINPIDEAIAWRKPQTPVAQKRKSDWLDLD